MVKANGTRTREPSTAAALIDAVGEPRLRRTLCAIVARLCAKSLSTWTSVPQLSPCDRLHAASALIALIQDVADAYGVAVPLVILRHRREVDHDLHEIIKLLHKWADELYPRHS